jgi:hypothetical protein
LAPELFDDRKKGCFLFHDETYYPKNRPAQAKNRSGRQYFFLMTTDSKINIKKQIDTDIAKNFLPYYDISVDQNDISDL